eukprot:5221944-Prymnesium_polylepis.1
MRHHRAKHAFVVIFLSRGTPYSSQHGPCCRNTFRLRTVEIIRPSSRIHFMVHARTLARRPHGWAFGSRVSRAESLKVPNAEWGNVTVLPK